MPLSRGETRRSHSSYIDNIMTRITLPGAVFLGMIGILPSIAASSVSTNSLHCSLAVQPADHGWCCLDTLQVIESYLLTKEIRRSDQIRPDSGPDYTGLQIGQPQ
jgi:hypothetical protein